MLSACQQDSKVLSTDMCTPFLDKCANLSSSTFIMVGFNLSRRAQRLGPDDLELDSTESC